MAAACGDDATPPADAGPGRDAGGRDAAGFDADGIDAGNPGDDAGPGVDAGDPPPCMAAPADLALNTMEVVTGLADPV
jgi:hypothetical protein